VVHREEGDVVAFVEAQQAGAKDGAAREVEREARLRGCQAHGLRLARLGRQP
jgi:hypothetical protein